MSRFVAVALGLPLLTAVLAPFRDSLSLSTEILVFLLAVVAASFLGGLAPALLAAVGGFLLLNYYFTPPLHSLTIASGENLFALAVFVALGVAVSQLVTLAERRRREASALAALLSAAGHDLRTPLAAATAAVDGLRVVNDPELVDTASVSLQRLGGLIEDLLGLSRLRLSVALEPVDVGEVVEVALRELGAELPVELPLDLPLDLPEVLADPVLLRRVVVNLVSNALRYGDSASVTASLAGRQVLVRVVDHGPGVPAGQQLFTPFQSTDGVGLGLALSRGLAEAMSGSLEASQTPGGGLTMTLTLRAL